MLRREWGGVASRAGAVGGEAVSAQRDGQRAALHALWAVPRILNFIPTEMRSHWKFLNGKVIGSD